VSLFEFEEHLDHLKGMRLLKKIPKGVMMKEDNRKQKGGYES